MEKIQPNIKPDNPLGHESINKLILKYSAPAIVGMMVASLYNFIDRIFIGNSPDLGADGLAGITIGFPLMVILMAFGFLFGVGGSTLFSIKLGEGREKDAEKALGNAFMMLIVFGFLYSLIGQIFLRPLVILFGASERVMPFTMEYMRIIFFGSIFQIGSLGMNNFVRADGSPKIAMLTMMIGAIINIILDPIFIFGLNMGMTGAALATVIAQGISFFWIVMYFRGKRSTHKIRLKHMIPDLPMISSISKLGLPGFLLQLVNSVLITFLNRSLLFYGGDIAISGMGIINSLQMMFLLPVIGVKQGIVPIISFNFGAGQYDRVKQTAKLASIYATLITVISYGIIILFPTQLISMFNQSPDLVAFGSHAVVRWFMFMPLVGFQIIGSNYFQAIGQYRSAMFLTLTRQLIVLIPAILVFPLFWGLNGLLYAAPFADFCATVMTGIWFYRSMKTLGRRVTDPVGAGTRSPLPGSKAAAIPGTVQNSGLRRLLIRLKG